MAPWPRKTDRILEPPQRTPQQNTVYNGNRGRRPPSILGHWHLQKSRLRKPTQTYLYLHHNSHHHPANKQSVLTSLIHRAKALCDQYSLAQHLEFLNTVFKYKGYSPQQIRATKPAKQTAKTNDKPISTAYILHTQTTYGWLSRMLAKHNIKSVALPPRKVFSYLPPVKDALGLRTSGIYRIPCECSRVYIGQSGRSIQIQIKEHNRHVRQAQPNK